MSKSFPKYSIFLVIIFFFIGIFFYIYNRSSNSQQKEVLITNFQECMKAGNAVMESYPRKCSSQKGEIFVEYIGNVLEVRDQIQLEYPQPNTTIENPLHISGQARGAWFFEATFPIVITNWDGLIIGEGYAEAQDDWMTNDFVPFQATLNFTQPTDKDNGTLIMHKANPSGLPEHDNALEIPIYFNMK